MDRLTEQITEIVKDCGLFILNADRRKSHVISKEGHANFVTDYDKKVQEILRRELLALLPGSRFVGEEDINTGADNETADAASQLSNGYSFIVDPIDGTTNFIKDYHASSISVGLLKNGEQFIGVVYNPYLDEMYSAKAGEGAYLNGKPVHVSENELSDGLVIMGTAPYYEELYDDTFKMARHYFSRSLDLRRSGSSAIDLCSIAAGRAELFFELRLMPWDFAAGSLIVKEAGGVVRTAEGKPLRFDRPCSVIASNYACGND
ncbi:MAG TPA: inositol monophosphatase [Lachnospiraceae bacterium]|nr:inositol monophosphatase [Lachnospiraceae bacterium]